MKILVDTNVILDVLCNRSGFVEASSKIWKLCEVGRIDGYISAVAALAAFALAPAAADYMIASHKSFEKGYTLAIETLGLKPFLSLDMRLGEGSGCPIAFSIIRGACDVMADMATFDEAEINDEYLEEIRQEEKYQK